MISKNLRFNYEQLLTLLVHIQAVINNRPPTFMYEELEEKVLIPYHIFIWTYNQSWVLQYTLRWNCFEWGITQISIEYMNTLNHFRKRWQNEYLVELREHQCCNAKSNYENEIYDVDIVLIHYERKPIAQWTLGVVQKINPSRDNKVRCYCDMH